MRALHLRAGAKSMTEQSRATSLLREPDAVLADDTISARQKAELIAEWFANNACEAMADRYGWNMRYERQGNEFVIFTDGIATNAVEIVDVQ